MTCETKVSLATPPHHRAGGEAMERGVEGFGRTSAENRPKSPTRENAIVIRAS